jgi:molybdenum cofactor biosynthesis enzyme
MGRSTYEFERLSATLDWPPMAAQRALDATGIRVSQEGWEGLDIEARKAIAAAGAGEQIDPTQVRQLLTGVSPREIALRQPRDDALLEEIPGGVVAALRLTGQPADLFWGLLRPLDRYVLHRLTHNSRLLVQAITEIALRTRQLQFAVSPRKWTGVVAHCEVHTSADLAQRLWDFDVLEGRGLVLARVAGVRSARRAGELLDMHRGQITGSIEIGSELIRTPGVDKVLWQAHVSTADGAFFAAASLLAVTTAATTVYDVLTNQLGGQASIEAGRLANEPWAVGWDEDDATVAARGL